MLGELSNILSHFTDDNMLEVVPSAVAHVQQSPPLPQALWVSASGCVLIPASSLVRPQHSHVIVSCMLCYRELLFMTQGRMLVLLKVYVCR